MEKIIRDVLIDYMEENGFFTKHQHGFRKGRSCATQLIEVMEQWTEDDKKNSIDVIYLDFQKAFDPVPHKRLIHKLKGYGISGNLLLWIEDFLHERKQRVVLNGQSSSWTEVTRGIPQGSVLGTDHLTSNKLNFQNHINKQVNKANQKLGLINRSFKYKDKDMFLQLFKSLVRPHLEYGSTVWSVANKKEAILIENVQRRATRSIKEIHLSYGNRLKHLGLPTLQYRRIRADVVETFKIIKGMDKVEIDTIFPKNNTATTREHKYKIYKKHCRTNRRKYSFSQRVVAIGMHCLKS
jgi:hypothetical protein